MSFYRTVLAAVAAIAIAAPVFADDSAPTSSSTTTTTTDSTTTEQTAVKVNLNTASAKELVKVKGINTSKAKAIVAFRKKNGDFKATSDIANVKGFKKLSPETLQSIEDQLTVE